MQRLFTGYNNPHAISAKCKEPELLMKLLDWNTSDGPNGGVNLVTYGIEGEHYTFDREKNFIDTSKYPAKELYKLGFSNPIRFIQVVDRRWLTEEARAGISEVNKPENLIGNKYWGTVPAMKDYPKLTTLWKEYSLKIKCAAPCILCADRIIWGRRLAETAFWHLCAAS